MSQTKKAANAGGAPTEPVGQGTRSPKERILEAAEQILLAEGYVGITTRRLAREAGLNQALIHYHFGSIDHVMMKVLERVGARSDHVIARSFEGPDRPLEKLHDHLSTVFNENVESGLAKVWFELIAMGANEAEMRPVIHRRFDEVLDTYERHIRPIFEGSSVPDRDQIEGLAALIQTMSYGILLQKVLGYDRGHIELLKVVDQLIERAAATEEAAPSPKRRRVK